MVRLEAAEQREQFFWDITKVIADFDEPGRVLQAIASRSVPMLADLCFFCLLSSNPDKTAPVAWAHVDPASHGLWEDKVSDRRLPASVEQYVAQAAKGQTVFASRLTRVESHLPESLRAEAAISSDGSDFHSLVAVPLIAASRVQGVAIFCLAQPHRSYQQEDIATIEEIGRIVAFVARQAQLSRQTVDQMSGFGAAQRLLQGAIDALTNHIAILDSQGRIIKVNQAWRAFAEFNQFNGTDYGLGSNYIEVCQPALSEVDDCDLPGGQAAQGIREVMEGGCALFTLEYPCHAPTERRWFLMRATRFGQGKAMCVVVAHENITERKLAEEALRESEETLSHAGRRFTASRLDGAA